jgi:hypothetical protein
MRLFRRESSSSTSSSCSSCFEKSVRFEEIDTVYYTHGSEYDRSATDEAPLHACLGRLSLSNSEKFLINNPKQDTIVEHNTYQNARRSAAGYAILLQIRSANQY